MKYLISSILVLNIVILSAFGQARIINITYSGNEATLTRNSPPAGVGYYWQGTGCGTLTDNGEVTYLASTSGTYYLRAYNSVSSSWASACASTIVSFPDVTAPVLSDVTAGPIYVGDPISAISNENGMVYLVPEGTNRVIGDINAAKVAEASAVADVAVSLVTVGIDAGDYIVYAVDAAENVSLASNSITINEPIDGLNQERSNTVIIYPPVIEDVLNIKTEAQMTSLQVYSINGTLIMNLNNPSEQINMSNLTEGVYIINIHLDNNILFVGKLLKK
jgi:hypothetical protein